MYRIWSERRLPAAYLGLLGDTAVLTASTGDEPDLSPTTLAGVHAILAASRVRYDAALMDRAPRLRVISRTGIGLDNVDVAAASARGIAVCNAPDAPSVSTAEHTIMLLLAVAKQLRRCDRELRRGEKQDFFNAYEGIEVRGRCLGLIGLGRIGSLVAKMAAALGMTVAGFDPFVSAEHAAGLGVARAPSLEALLREADFVSLHLPLTGQTRHLINAGTLRLMKPGSALINCARGGLVDEAALLEALESGHLRGAGLDVFDPEPPPPDHPLLSRDDVIATPHVAGATDASKDRLWRTAITQALQVLRGERPPFLVNPEVWPRRDA